MRLKTVIFLLFSCVASLVAQEFTYVDWNILRPDTVPVHYEEVIPLEEDYARFRYEVRLDYPEYAPLTEVEVKRVAVWAENLPESPEVHTNVGISRRKGMLDVYFVPIVRRDGKYYKLISFKMNIIRHAQNALRVSAVSGVREAAERYAAHSVLAQGRWVKIGIQADGVYRLTRSDLQRMGFNDPSRVKLYGYGGHVQDEEIKADTDFDDLEEIPLYRDDRGVLFFGKGLVTWSKPDYRGKATHRVNTYARQACYFLTEGDAPQTIRLIKEEAGTGKSLNYTLANLLYKKEEFSWYQTGRNFYEAANFAHSGSRTYQIPVVDPVVSSKGYLKIYFTAANRTSDSYVQPTVDGRSLNTIRISQLSSEYMAAQEGTGNYTLETLREGTAGTEVTLSYTAGADARLGYIELCYRRQLLMRDPYLYIRHYETTSANFMIESNGRSGLKVWRLGRSGVPMVEMQGTWSGSTYQVPVSDPTLEYVAVDVNADYPSPTIIGEVGNQDLHAMGAADMVIIIPASGKLYGQAERLAEAHRTLDGLRVTIVRADQVYNEFSSGTPDATAYRRMMKMLYDRAAEEEDMPRYLLLFGDGLWDNRMVTDATQGLNPDDYLLCYESENSLSHTVGYVMEDYYGLLDDGEGVKNLTLEKTDLGVGRFPVTTVADAKIMVDKTIDYMENRNAGAWKNEICVMGDDGDNNDHMNKAKEIVDLVEQNYPAMQVNPIYWDAYKREAGSTNYAYPGVRADIEAQMEKGCLVMDYVGHGNPREFSHEKVLLLNDFSAVKSNKIPLWITAACDVTPFDMMVDNIGERAVLNQSGAAVAFYGTTRTVYSSGNGPMNRFFMYHLLGRDENGRRNTIGDAVRLAKVQLLTVNEGGDKGENKLHFVLLGDPALKLGVPEYKLVIETINGKPVGEDKPFAEFKAGNIAQVTGYVADLENRMLSDYSGVLSATVYDSESEITCLNNDGKAETSFVYTIRDKRLYSGSDSVRNGKFSMNFPIPMDIKYSGGTGRVVLYAIDNEKRREANGYTENVYVGGSGDDLSGDKEGPKVTAYLNREDFVSGGTVNTTPYFVAMLEDESGINVTNTAVGHDLELVIDGEPARTYILNDEYANDFGDYRKGQLAYVIPALSNGQHTLSFRAWDVMNNSSVITFDFNVDSKLSPDFINLTCTDNPARTQTTFIVRYDRPGTPCDFMLEVFDFAGRKLWSHTEQGTSTDGIYPVTWNLTTSAGMPLSTGVYLYRVSVATEGSKMVSRTNKIVILSNK